MRRNRKYSWNQVPLLRPILPFSLGILTGIYFTDFHWMFVATALVFLLLLPAYVLRYKALGSALTMCLFALFGFVFACIRTDHLYNPHYSLSPYLYEASCFRMRILSEPVVRERSVKMEALILNMYLRDQVQEVHGKVMLYIEVDEQAKELQIGDELMLLGTVQNIPKPENPGEFDYRGYLKQRQISHRCYTAAGKWKVMSNGGGIIRQLIYWRRGVMNTLASKGINDRELAIVSALLVGYKHHLTADQKAAFSAAGAMHVLAVSGLHVGIVFLMISGLLKPMTILPGGNFLRAVLVIVSLWLYAALTGMSPSVTRASTMFSFVIAGKGIGRFTSVFNTIAGSAFLLLALNPYLLLDLGFQLSYLAVLGIVSVQPRIAELWTPRNFLLKKAWDITTVSIAAQLATFPLGLLYFHQFPNYFLLSNLVVIPAASAILPLGMALVALHKVQFISGLLSTSLYHAVRWLDQFICEIESWPGAVTDGIFISTTDTIWIYSLLVAIFGFVASKKYSYLMMAMLMVALIEGSNVAELLKHRNGASLVFYKVRDAHVVDYMLGNRYATELMGESKVDSVAIQYHVAQHRMMKGVKKAQPEAIGLINEGCWRWFQGVRIFCLSDPMQFTGVLETDVLWVMKHPPEDVENVLKLIRPKQVVLSHLLDYGSHDKWTKVLDTAGVPYHSMRQEGAFVLNF